MKPLSLEDQLKRLDKYRDQYNPLRGLTVERCRSLIESYTTGQCQELMWAFGAPYFGIESADPDLLALIERRVSRLLSMDWDILVAEDKDEDPKALAQQEALKSAYERFDNLYEAIEHLELASFRGYSHVEIDWQNNAFICLDPWNVVRDGLSGPWKVNHSGMFVGYEAVPDAMRIDPAKHWFIIREVRRPIGAWAMLKFFYSALGHRDWGTYVGVYGVPGGVVIGPPDIPEDKEGEYESAAINIAAGGSGYLPNGSQWVPNTAAAGTQPFDPWLKHLSEKLILAGTGGLLTMLTEAGSGTLAGGAHSDAFDQIAAMEAQRISELFQRYFDRRVLEAAGLLQKGERPLAYFDMLSQEELDAGSVVTQVSTLTAAGYKVDPGQIEEKTGYKLTENEEIPAETESLDPLPNQKSPVVVCNALQFKRNAKDDRRQGATPESVFSGKFERLLELIESQDEESIQKGMTLIDALDPGDLAPGQFEDLEQALMKTLIEGGEDAKTDT